MVSGSYSHKNKTDAVLSSYLIKKSNCTDARCQFTNTRSNRSVLDTEGHTSLYGIC